MSRFEILMSNNELYIYVASLYFEAGDVEMGTFYKNAALGYKIKAYNLKLEDAGRG